MSYLKARLAERDTKLGLLNAGLTVATLLFPASTTLIQMAAGIANAYFMATPSTPAAK
jgi:hypothetical protein